MYHPVVEITQQPLDVRGYDPSLCAKEQDSLHYGKVKIPQFLSVCALPPQDTQNSGLALAQLLDVGDD